MTAAIQVMQSSALTSHTQPHSPVTTAAVREHACLFTHDLRRKQKRWQDGRLKYHTFNRRVMVYDERGNFIGDTHWRESYDLVDGDDLELERGGTIIQVGECVGSRDQDLSELIDKRAHERAQRQVAAAARRPPTALIAPLHMVKTQVPPRRHLHEVIGTPSGHHGRAVVPKESPYEERQQRQAPLRGNDARSAKRQRTEYSPPSKSGYAQNLFGATLTLSGRPLIQGSSRHCQSKAPLAREEMASPLSLDASKRGDSGSAAIDDTHILKDTYSPPLRQKPLLSEDIQISKKAVSGVNGSMELSPFPHMGPDVSGEAGEAPTPQEKQPKATVSQRDISRGRSTLDPRTTNRKSGRLKGCGDTRNQEDINIDGSGKPPAVGASKRLRDKGRPDTSNNGGSKREPRDRNTIDLTGDPAGVPPNQPVDNEPRTELKIKPRKKRGLLMISEEHTKRASSSETESNKSRPDIHSIALASKAQLANASANARSDKVGSTYTQRKQIDPGKEMQNPPRQNEMDQCGDDDYSDDQGCRGLRYIDHPEHSIEEDEHNKIQHFDQLRSDPREASELSSVTKQSDPQRLETCTIGTEKRLRPRKQLSTVDDSSFSAMDRAHGRLPSVRREDSTPVDEMPAPRLAKLGRKNVKSREVIGFIFDEESEPTLCAQQNHQTRQEPCPQSPPTSIVRKQHRETDDKARNEPASGEARLDVEVQSPRKTLLAAKKLTTLQSNKKALSPDDEACLTVQTEAPSTVAAITSERPIPLINNPATRGMKAARPSDAAGQMPVCPLSIEPAGGSSLNQVPRKANAQENLEKGSAGSMPGFSRANGGPWSREAHDLFDFKRPS